jgi:hypothetical protein
LGISMMRDGKGGLPLVVLGLAMVAVQVVAKVTNVVRWYRANK